MCCFDGVQKGNYFRGELISRTEVALQVKKLKNRKTADKNEVMGEMIEDEQGG